MTVVPATVDGRPNGSAFPYWCLVRLWRFEHAAGAFGDAARRSVAEPLGRWT